MTANEKITQVDLKSLRVIKYPDPRLNEVSTPIERVDESVRALAERMFELMFAGKGVGLAAPQVGITVRLFIVSPTSEPQDGRVMINPELIASEGREENE